MLKRLFSKDEKDSLYFYKFTALVALEILLAFSVFGYIFIKPVAITFMHIPVLIGALLLGPWEGMLLGILFGITSLWKATVAATLYADMVFSPFLSGAPLNSLILSVGTRALFGLIAGWIFLYIKKKNAHIKVWIFVGSIFATLLHKELVFLAFHFLFPAAGIKAGLLSGGLDLYNWLDMVFTGAVVFVIYKLWTLPWVQRLVVHLRKVRWSRNKEEQFKYLFLGCVLSLLLWGSLVLHFYGRAQIIFAQDAVILSSLAFIRFLQLGLQFLIASMAISYLLSLLVIILCKYLSEMKQLSEHDVLTGLFNRQAFEMQISFLQRGRGGIRGAFFILDVDDFKYINDTYGHPFGDKILKEVASCIRECLDGKAVIGRIGGDEFCVFLPEQYTREHVECMAGTICSYLRKIAVGKEKSLSASMGIAYEDTADLSYTELYKRADEALYCVKKQQKNGYAFWQEKTV